MLPPSRFAFFQYSNTLAAKEEQALDALWVYLATQDILRLTVSGRRPEILCPLF